MKRSLLLVLILSLLLSACGATGEMEVRESWARPAAQGENGAIYFVIHNGTRTADELTGVASDVADAVEMHESKMEGDVMQMHQLQSVPLSAGEETTFKPGGLHIMLIGIKNDLKVGDEVKVTLHFKNNKDIELLIPVKDASMPAEQ